jgi:hypothetical protein
LVFVSPSHRNIRNEEEGKDKYLHQSKPAVVDYVELIVCDISEQAAVDAVDETTPDQQKRKPD